MGSTDGTSAFLSTIQDPRFHCFEFTANRGGSIARNEGIKNAKGDLIAFLDDDDWWEPVKLENRSGRSNGKMSAYVIPASRNGLFAGN